MAANDGGEFNAWKKNEKWKILFQKTRKNNNNNEKKTISIFSLLKMR